MKKLFLMLAAAAAVASCSKDYTIVADQGEAIEFGSFVENSTRAAADPSLNATNFTEFNVWGTVGGVPIYTGNKVTGKVGNPTGGADYIWTCASVKQYWIEGAVYKFAALRNEGTVTLDENDLPSKVTFDATAADVDLLYAKNYGTNDNGIIGQTSGNNNPVNFDFEHLLSKVKFTVKNNSTTAVGYSFNVTNIDVKGSKTGTVVLSDRTWEAKGDPTAVYEVTEIAVNQGATGVECAKELLLIPGEFKVSFDVQILCNGTVVATHNSAVNTVTFAGGNSYNLVITVAVGEEIKFSVTEQPEWNYDVNGDDVVNDNDNIKLQ